MLDEPVRRVQPDKDRDPEGIDPDLRETFRALVRGDEPWPLFLHGLAGTGKTCAALCLADRVGYDCWWALPDLCEAQIEAMHGRYLDKYGFKVFRDGIWGEWENADVGFMDEIGIRATVSEHHFETLKRALDRRDGKPTVYVSNLGIHDLLRLYDDRVASRLAAGTVVELTGPDRRLKK